MYYLDFEIKITMILAGALATWNYCNCEKINDDKVAFSHTRKIFSIPASKQQRWNGWRQKKNVELIETLFHLEVVYLSVSALLVLCISWFSPRGLKLFRLAFQILVSKGQLISECLLDVFIWTKKTNENISVFLP